MNRDELYKDIDGTIDQAKNLLNRKNTVYNDNEEDALASFKTASKLQHVTPPQALAGMMAKHTASVYDLIWADCTSMEVMDEKILDHINYLLLLRALYREHLDEKFSAMEIDSTPNA